jgi:hypothetical protein
MATGGGVVEQLKGGLKQIEQYEGGTDALLLGLSGVTGVSSLGFGATGLSDTEKETFKNMLVGQGSEVALAASVQALKKSGTEEDAAQASKLEETLRSKLTAQGKSEAEIDDIFSKAEGFSNDKGRQKALRAFGQQGARMGVLALDMATLGRERAMGARGVRAGVKGMEALRDAGVSAFSEATGETYGDDEKLRGALRSMLGDTEQRNKAGSVLVKAAQAALEEGLSPEERARRTGIAREALGSWTSGGITTGSKGAGSAAEGEARDMKNTMASIGAEAMADLRAATADLKDATQSIRTAFNLPRPSWPQ